MQVRQPFSKTWLYDYREPRMDIAKVLLEHSLHGNTLLRQRCHGQTDKVVVNIYASETDIVPMGL